MIHASKKLVEFINSQNSIEDFADKLGVTRQTVYNILNQEMISSEIIAKIINETGMDFEKAFDINE